MIKLLIYIFIFSGIGFGIHHMYMKYYGNPMNELMADKKVIRAIKQENLKSATKVKLFKAKIIFDKNKIKKVIDDESITDVNTDFSDGNHSIVL